MCSIAICRRFGGRRAAVIRCTRPIRCSRVARRAALRYCKAVQRAASFCPQGYSSCYQCRTGSTVALPATCMPSTQAVQSRHRLQQHSLTSSQEQIRCGRAGSGTGQSRLRRRSRLSCSQILPRRCAALLRSHIHAQPLMLLPAGIPSRLLRKASRPRLPQCRMLCPQCQ